MEHLFRITTGKKGYLTCIYNNRYIYSAYDPPREAEKFVNGKGELKKVVITCCGLDYVNRVLLNGECEQVISLEPLDFENDLNDQRLTRVSSTRALEKLLLAKNLHARDCSFLVWQPLVDVLPDLFAPLFHQIKEVLEKVSLSSLAAGQFGALETFNLLRNLTVMDKVEYCRIRDGALKVPVLVCSSGPGLAASISFIQLVRNNCYCIALPGAVGYLISRGITPDAVIAVDPGIATMYHLYKIDVPMVLLTTLNVNPALFHNKNLRPVLFSYNNYFEQILFENLDITIAPAEGSVILNCLRLLPQIGVSDIVLCGQDFAYLDSRSHCPGGTFEDMFLGQSGYLNTVEQQIIALDFRYEMVSVADGIGQLKTNRALKLYHDHFLSSKFDCTIHIPDTAPNRLHGSVKLVDSTNPGSLFDHKPTGDLFDTALSVLDIDTCGITGHLNTIRTDQEQLDKLFCSDEKSRARLFRLLERINEREAT